MIPRLIKYLLIGRLKEGSAEANNYLKTLIEKIV